jgi:tetratricopeptide (TPR) repeat protein
LTPFRVAAIVLPVIPSERFVATRLATAALVFCVAGCAPQVVVDPPPQPDYSLLDPDVATLLKNKVAEIEERPRDAELRGQLGLACDLFMILPSARTAFEQATVLDPDDARWWYHLARMRAELGDVEAALDDVDQSIRLHPGYAPAFWRRGYWLLDLGRQDEAETAFRLAVHRDPAALAARVGLARVHLEREQGDEAVRILTELLPYQPENGYLHHLLMTAYRQQGQMELVEEMMGRAESTPPVWPDAWRDERLRYEVGYAADLKKAERLLGQSRFEEAITLLEELRTQRPDDVTLLNNLGAAYIDTGRVDDGIQTLLAALRHDPGHFGSHLNLSRAYELKRLPHQALDHADKAITANPYLAQAHERRGIVLARLKRYREALESLEAARRFDARRSTSLIWSGLVHVELGEWQAAIENLQTAAELVPGSFVVHITLAHARAESGDLSGASTALDRAAQLRPDDPRIEEVRQRIQTRQRSGAPADSSDR